MEILHKIRYVKDFLNYRIEMNFISRTYHRIRAESREHLEESRQTYCGHLAKSVKTSFNMLCASAAVLIHGVVPAWCKKTGYQMILREADNMEERPEYPKRDE